MNNASKILLAIALTTTGAMLVAKKEKTAEPVVAPVADPTHMKMCGQKENDYCRFFTERDCIKCQIPGIDARGYTQESKNLSGANMFKAQLQGAQLEYAILAGTDLREADLRGTNLRYANLHGAKLDGALVDKSTRIGHTTGKIGGKPAKHALKALRPERNVVAKVHKAAKAESAKRTIQPVKRPVKEVKS